MRFVFLILSVCCLMASQAVGQGLPAAEIEWPEGKSEIEIPFDYSKGLIVIPVSVMGSKTLHMILDTGSPLIVLPDEELAATMELNIVMNVPVGGTGDGEPETAPLAFGVSANVGGLAISNGNLIVGAAKDVLRGFDGVIGASIFGNCVVELDWDKKFVRLHDPSSFDYSGDGTILDLAVAGNGHPYIDGFAAKLNGSEWIDLHLHFDSGYRGSLTLYTDSHELIELPEPAYEAIIAWGSRGAARGWVGRIDGLRIEGSEFSDIGTNFQQELDDGMPGTPEHHGSLGLGVLDRFHTIVDYRGGRLILEATPRVGDPFPANTTGVGLAPWVPGDESVEIADVYPSSPATEVDIRTGDRITRINDRGVANMSALELREIWRRAAGTILEITIERNGELIERKLVTRDLI